MPLNSKVQKKFWYILFKAGYFNYELITNSTFVFQVKTHVYKKKLNFICNK